MSKIFLIYDNDPIEMLKDRGYVLHRRPYKIKLKCGSCANEIDITKSTENVKYIDMYFPDDHKYSLQRLREIANYFQLEEEFYERTNIYMFKKQIGSERPVAIVKKVTCPSCGQVHYCCFALTGDHSHAPGQFLHLIGIKTVE